MAKNTNRSTQAQQRAEERAGRTPAEQLARVQARLQLVGGTATRETRRLKLAIAGVTTAQSKSARKRANQTAQATKRATQPTKAAAA